MKPSPAVADGPQPMDGGRWRMGAAGDERRIEAEKRFGACVLIDDHL